MFGSCCDILLTVKDSCQAAEHGDDTATFCERTIAGTIISSIGMALGSLAALVRFFNPNPKGTLQKAEAVYNSTREGHVSEVKARAQVKKEQR